MSLRVNTVRLTFLMVLYASIRLYHYLPTSSKLLPVLSYAHYYLQSNSPMMEGVYIPECLLLRSVLHFSRNVYKPSRVSIFADPGHFLIPKLSVRYSPWLQLTRRPSVAVSLCLLARLSNTISFLWVALPAVDKM